MTAPVTHVDEATTYRHVLHAIEDALGRRGIVRSLSREPSPFATFFPAEVVTATLWDGAELQLFVKHLDGRAADHPEKHRRDRELRVYAELLCAPGLPVPRSHGGSWDASERRGLLLLEYLDDWNLRHQDLEHWFTAARRLAHLHRHFATRSPQLEESDFLLHFDGPFFDHWAQRALEVVGSLSADLGMRLAPLVETWTGGAEALARQPPTLVHNDLSPKNVIADRSLDPARICIVDWEMAGIGCGVLDLVHLSYGFDPANERRMRDAYCDELAGSGLLPADAGDIDALLGACALHKTLYRLAFSATWNLPLDRVAEWVGDAEQLLQEATAA